MSTLKQTIKQVISRYGHLTEGMADELNDEINRHFIVTSKEEYLQTKLSDSEKWDESSGCSPKK
tara:strand:+ start:643 stop:834 length:192 start_codon:yes stop_codon:yes gene_type:complete